MSKLSVGAPAPKFQLQDLLGKQVSLEDFLGQVVLVNFWSAECPWVERVDRALLAEQAQVVLLCVASNANEPPEMLRKVAEERGLAYVLPDPGQQVADQYGVEVTPHFFLIDSEGLLRYQGAFDDVTFRQREPSQAYLFDAIQALHRGEPVPLAETIPYGCTLVRHKVI